MEIKFIDEVYRRIKVEDDPYEALLEIAAILTPDLRRQVVDVGSLVKLLHKEECYVPMMHVMLAVLVDGSNGNIVKYSKTKEAKTFRTDDGLVLYCDLFSIFRACDYDFDKMTVYLLQHRVRSPVDFAYLHIVLSRTDVEDLEGFLNMKPLRDHTIFTAQRELDYEKQKTSIELVKPYWWDSKLSNDLVKGQLTVDHEIFINSCQHSIDGYEQLIGLGLTPVQASVVLPRAEKKVMVITADSEYWSYIFKFINSRKGF